eukprot:gene3777-4127_t
MAVKSKKGGKKKKVKKEGNSSSTTGIINPAYVESLRLPPIAPDVRLSTLQSTIITHDINSFQRLITHYNYSRDVKKVNTDHSTLLHLAIKAKDMLALQELLQLGTIDLNQRETSLLGGYTAIHLACVNNDVNGLACLLQAGGNPNVKADSTIGETALMLCCKHDYTQCARFLLRAGADVTIVDNFGNNASFWAYRHNHTHLIQDLQLPASHSATAMELLALQRTRIPGFTLPEIKKKKKKGDKKKAKK